MNNTYPINIIPENDVLRVEALQRYRIFNTVREGAFDNIAKLAKTIFNVPVAHISFLDGEHEFIKASAGLPEMGLVDRGESLCALTVMTPEVVVIENALEEPLLANHPYVHGEFALRFYAGAPIITPDQYVIGTMCLVDRQTRKFTYHEIEILRDLASVVMEQLELRLSNIEKSQRQKETNDQLATSEERLQGILDTMAEGVTIIDNNRRLVYANPMAQKILELSEDEIREHTYDQPKWQNLRLDGTPMPDYEHPMTVIMNTGLPVYDQEVGIQLPDRETFYISVNAAPIFDEEGKLTGGIGTFMDVTNRRLLMKQKDEFISIASHELKTPITSLKASLQMLDRIKATPTSPILPNLITQANKSLEKLNNLVNDLLNVKRIAEGQLQLRKTTFIIAGMINSCCHHIRTAGEFDIKLSGDTDLQIHADEHQIEQVVVNMVNNAVKYAPQSKQITIIVEELGDFAKISVSDKGPGIAADKLPHLFERYYRADYGGLQFSGLGLGLYISSDIIKRHGGEIGVESEVGKGSMFWFTLPLSATSLI